MDTETIPVFVDTCPRCGDYSLEQIPDAPAMVSYTAQSLAQYHVRCRRCGMDTTSTKLSEGREVRGRFKDYLKDAPIKIPPIDE